MPYVSTVNDQTYHIDTGENTPQRDITIDGITHNIDWRHIAPLAADPKGQSGVGGRYSLIIENKSYEIFARRLSKPDETNGQTYEIEVAGQRFEVYIEDEREKALAGAVKSARETGNAMVRAPMPGLVLGIPHAVGTSVTRGQTVIVLEAMKMENDLSSPIAGTIEEVHVSKGQTVNQGDILVVISAE
jgi:biotin carboxyl carrier protein